MQLPFNVTGKMKVPVRMTRQAVCHDVLGEGAIKSEGS